MIAAVINPARTWQGWRRSLPMDRPTSQAYIGVTSRVRSAYYHQEMTPLENKMIRSKILRSIFIGYVLSACLIPIAGAEAADGRKCTYVLKDGSVSDPVYVIYEGGDVIRMRFLGSTPDRYFAQAAGQGKIEYTQFGTRSSGSDLAAINQIRK
jgi:hypothetical protein